VDYSAPSNKIKRKKDLMEYIKVEKRFNGIY